jgi:thiosulfate dehydrogenase (quinone) large subunit
MPPIYPTGNPTRPRASYETARPSLDASARVRYAWASVRVVLGAIFFWAFLDKLLGLGYATKASSAWINGGSPTRGFLTFGTA